MATTGVATRTASSGRLPNAGLLFMADVRKLFIFCKVQFSFYTFMTDVQKLFIFCKVQFSFYTFMTDVLKLLVFHKVKLSFYR